METGIASFTAARCVHALRAPGYGSPMQSVAELHRVSFRLQDLGVMLWLERCFI